jgi:hypothetical protein
MTYFFETVGIISAFFVFNFKANLEKIDWKYFYP